MDTSKSEASIQQAKSEFQTLDTTVQSKVEEAKKAMEAVNDSNLVEKLKEAQFNLSYAESDESGGFHNHPYIMALLTDAQQRAEEILNAMKK